MQLSKIVAIIPAAGQGKRMGANINKQYLELNNKPVIAWTLALFEQATIISEVILVVSASELDYCQKHILDKFGFVKVKLVAGGKERQDSVYNGLKEARDAEIVVVHDGARPLLTMDNLEEVVMEAVGTGGAILAVPVKDTIKVVTNEKEIEGTPARNSLYAAQTPQAFQRRILMEAYEKAFATGYIGTDDASLVEQLSATVKIVVGSYENIKVTTGEDLIIAEAILQRREK
ncbi:MAG: 2-C-methyl-D-erythritol 4-phosphate cytidylyltransferase [Bacillota bacterium]|nr:2-C-methyl-D-erythritol 4-phosphate cytidylyltransferase [Bacillota bacterium]